MQMEQFGLTPEDVITLHRIRIERMKVVKEMENQI